jgi:hypothetical protein
MFRLNLTKFEQKGHVHIFQTYISPLSSFESLSVAFVEFVEHSRVVHAFAWNEHHFNSHSSYHKLFVYFNHCEIVNMYYNIIYSYK